MMAPDNRHDRDMLGLVAGAFFIAVVAGFLWYMNAHARDWLNQPLTTDSGSWTGSQFRKAGE